MQKTDKILEVGSGSGYLTALLAEKGAHVYSVEIVPELKAMAENNLRTHGITNVTVEQGDAAQGWSKHEPYDVIVLTASTPILPETFLKSLNPGGRLFAIVGEDPVMEALLINCTAPGEFKTTQLFETCTAPFINALQTYPHDPEIEKGLAYVYLWQGSPDVAIDMFEDLQEEDPSNPEYYNALAYAHLQRYETIEARRLVNHAINIDPENVAAQQIKSSLAYAPPFLEADIWGGYTQIGEMSRAGLRAVQLSTQVSRSFRALVSYDNNMSLDNFYYVDQHLQAETYLAGGVVNWDKHYNTRLQLGYRDLASSGSQMLALGEQAVNLKDKKVIKAGGMYAIGHNVPDEWMMYAGINIPVMTHLRVEPVYYISHRDLAPSMEHRIGLNSQWTGKSGLEIGAGGHYGKVNAGSELGTAGTYGIYIAALIPVHRMVWLQANLRHEKGVAGMYQMAGFGVKLRFEQ